nr:uncharacterized protein LOC105348132 isoform X1 [Crassostrea gigas]
MNYSFFLLLVLIILQVELCTSQNRYCQEAVASVEVVDSCPTSKAQWDVAARKKNCGRMASKQNCTTVEKYQYHCVVNGLRSELLEVCGPTRIIFGHCVEFNVLGGVIQDQLSAPCNAAFPKCAEYYLSSEIYKYPDCYKLVLKNEGSLGFEEKTKTTTSKSTLITTNSSGQEKSFRSVWIFVIISVLLIAVVLVLIICIRKTMCHRKQPNRKHNEAVFSNVENGEGDVKCVYIKSEPCMENEDEEMTSLIPKKVKFEQDIRKPLCHTKQPNRKHNEAVFSNVENGEGDVKCVYIKSEPCMENEDEEMTSLIPKKVKFEQDIQHSSPDQSLSRRFSQSESAVNNIQNSASRQSMRQPVDQDIRRRTSTQSMSQRFARSDSAAYNKGFKVSDFLM